MRRAFISSTSKDLEDYRRVAIDICSALDIHPEAMEHWSSKPVGAVEGSQQEVDGTDLYIGIFGFRYGHIADGETKSVTELEFDFAVEQGLDRLCFVAHSDLEAMWPHKDPKNADKLKAFHDRINELIRAEFRNKDDFAVKFVLALVQNGYYDGKDLPPYAVYKPPSPPPVDELPDVGRLPLFSRMTHSRNPSFVGREDDLKDIAKVLLHGDGGAVGIVAAAAVGIGGLGKTQLAVEFCYRYGRFFQGVHWLQLPVSLPFMAGGGTLLR
ncbi:MAG: DUF4062 domain-containing protein [Chloroflexi bacterium]|nr:DUF4062 domain-containing protein [Chloroflexota bacterium]